RLCFFFFSSRRRHTRSKRDWSSDVCSSDLIASRQVCGVGSTRPKSRDSSLSRITTCGWYQRPPPWQVSQETPCTSACPARCSSRSEERRVGKEWRAEGAAEA